MLAATAADTLKNFGQANNENRRIHTDRIIKTIH